MPLPIAAIAAAAPAVTAVVNNISKTIGGLFKGKTPHITWEECNSIVHALVDEWCSVVLAQTQTEDERRTLAAMAVQSLDADFYKTYQTNVENLSGVRLTWLYDNWKEATGKPVGMWDMNQLKNTIGSFGTSVNQMFVNSVWRVGMLAFTNSAPGDSSTVEPRANDVLKWYVNLIAKFSVYVNRTIKPVPGYAEPSPSSVSIQTTSTNEKPEDVEIFVRSADIISTNVPKPSGASSSSPENNQDFTGMVVLGALAVLLIVLFTRSKHG